MKCYCTVLINLVIILPIFTRIVNCSWMSGIFPNALKKSIINPVIKIHNLDNNKKNYRPVANMKFMSKVIEKAASCQVTTYVDGNNLGEIHQSSYKRFHSIESALLVFVVLLDLSASFDTVEHSILLNIIRVIIDSTVLCIVLHTVHTNFQKCNFWWTHSACLRPSIADISHTISAHKVSH